MSILRVNYKEEEPSMVGRVWSRRERDNFQKAYGPLALKRCVCHAAHGPAKPGQDKFIHLHNGGSCSRRCRSRKEKADKIPTFRKFPFQSGQIDCKQAK